MCQVQDSVELGKVTNLEKFRIRESSKLTKAVNFEVSTHWRTRFTYWAEKLFFVIIIKSSLRNKKKHKNSHYFWNVLLEYINIQVTRSWSSSMALTNGVLSCLKSGGARVTSRTTLKTKSKPVGQNHHHHQISP